MTKVTLEDLHFERFKHHSQVPAFDCGNHGLNEFITTDEALRYEQDGMGRTWVVRLAKSWEVVAFYTTAPGGLSVTWAKRMPRIRPEYHHTTVPGVLVGRLAVCNGHKGRSIGKQILTKIAFQAIKDDNYIFRVLYLNAEPESIGFYEGFGFVKSDHRKNKGRDKPLMHFDLDELRRAVGIDGIGSSPSSIRLN